MEICFKSMTNEMESFEPFGLKSYVRHILGDDYDLMPTELLDDEDLSLLSPTNFQQAITA